MEEQELNNPVEILKKKKEYAIQRIEFFKFKFTWLTLAAIIGSLGGYGVSVLRFNELKENLAINEVVGLISLGAFLGSSTYIYFITLFKISSQTQLRRIDIELSQYGTEELQDKIEENFFTKLVQINFKYIDQYYLQTQEQADKSFKLALGVSVAAMVIIVSGIIMMFFNITSPAYLTTGAGILSEFIASIFFYLYNKTVLKMSQYHKKLVMTQNISLALKISENMDSVSKGKVQELIIDRLTTDINKHLSKN